MAMSRSLIWINLFKYSRNFSFVEYIDIINIHGSSFHNFVGKLDLSLPLVVGELPQNTVDIIISVTYKPVKHKNIKTTYIIKP